jgi:hypothetical protein
MRVGQIIAVNTSYLLLQHRLRYQRLVFFQVFSVRHAQLAFTELEVIFLYLRFE